jgi:hypothetical protein
MCAAALEKADDKAMKQFSISLKSVDQLKDGNYHQWRSQIERAALASNWHASILDPSVDKPEPWPPRTPSI